MVQQNNNQLFWSCGLWVVICLVISALAGWVSAEHAAGWYSTINKPSFNPPKEIFAPIWTTLYLMIGIAGGLIWCQRKHCPALLSWFIVHLLLNFAWSFIFFNAQSILWALVDIVMLWASLLITLVYAYRCEWRAGLLLTPYFLWVSFAVILNAALFHLN